MPGREFFHGPPEVKQVMLREQTQCEIPDVPTTGIVAYLGDEPVGWCAVEPRSNLFTTSRTPVPWKGRTEDRTDPSVWAITCFTVRAGYRRRGIMKALALAAVDHARDGGARVVEGYPMVTVPGVEITWEELHVGSVSAFDEAGFELITAPTPRRKVMRLTL
jgi:GNAT superfamily N-acetyltransferase